MEVSSRSNTRKGKQRSLLGDKVNLGMIRHKPSKVYPKIGVEQLYVSPPREVTGLLLG